MTHLSQLGAQSSVPSPSSTPSPLDLAHSSRAAPILALPQSPRSLIPNASLLDVQEMSTLDPPQVIISPLPSTSHSAATTPPPPPSIHHAHEDIYISQTFASFLQELKTEMMISVQAAVATSSATPRSSALFRFSKKPISTQAENPSHENLSSDTSNFYPETTTSSAASENGQETTAIILDDVAVDGGDKLSLRRQPSSLLAGVTKGSNVLQKFLQTCAKHPVLCAQDGFLEDLYVLWKLERPEPEYIAPLSSLFDNHDDISISDQLSDKAFCVDGGSTRGASPVLMPVLKETLQVNSPSILDHSALNFDSVADDDEADTCSSPTIALDSQLNQSERDMKYEIHTMQSDLASYMKVVPTNEQMPPSQAANLTDISENPLFAAVNAAKEAQFFSANASSSEILVTPPVILRGPTSIILQGHHIARTSSSPEIHHILKGQHAPSIPSSNSEDLGTLNQVSPSIGSTTSAKPPRQKKSKLALPDDPNNPTIKKRPVSQRALTCSNCLATSTPLWRRSIDKAKVLCNACGIYLRQHGRQRPVSQQLKLPLNISPSTGFTIDVNGRIFLASKESHLKSLPENQSCPTTSSKQIDSGQENMLEPYPCHGHYNYAHGFQSFGSHSYSGHHQHGMVHPHPANMNSSYGYRSSSHGGFHIVNGSFGFAPIPLSSLPSPMNNVEVSATLPPINISKRVDSSRLPNGSTSNPPAHAP